jgi:hypothetical protein
MHGKISVSLPADQITWLAAEMKLTGKKLSTLIQEAVGDYRRRAPGRLIDSVLPASAGDNEEEDHDHE